jgi:hypothetical protein
MLQHFMGMAPFYISLSRTTTSDRRHDGFAEKHATRGKRYGKKHDPMKNIF